LSGVVKAMALSPDGRRIAAASGKMVRVFDSENGKLLGEMDGHRDEVTALAFSTDGKRLVTGSADKTVRIWTPDE
jgi:WD40 repeat protein